MATNFVRNFLVALSVFIVIVVLMYTNLKFAEPITKYVSFVVTTDFSIQPIIQKTGLVEGWETWDLDSLIQGWSKTTSGW